jgi:23S rRNA (cytosine1962-C5)-methyltransferase
VPVAPPAPPYDQLANRLRRVHRHRRTWGRRRGITCWRLYERDIPDQPLIVDWYDGDAVVWTFDRTRNETAADQAAWVAAVLGAVCAGLDLPQERVWLKERRRQEGGQYQRLGRTGAVKTVAEHGLGFEVNLSDYLDTGLFLDHRPTRMAVRAQAAGRRVLNLFAYTGAFTVHARAGGAAATTTVDLNQNYLDWARRNLAHNGFAEDAAHALVRADCLAWLAQEARARPGRWDIVVCDPPTFSNSTAMAHDFSVVRDQGPLLARCAALLAPGGTLWFSTNARGFELTEPPPLAVTETSAESVSEDFRNRRAHRCWRMQRC